MTNLRRCRRAEAIFGLVLILGTACGGSAAETPNVRTGDPAAPSDPSGPGSTGVRAGLEGAGLTRAADQETTGFLVEGQSVVHEVTAPPGACLTLTVRGATGLRDVDTTLYAPDGSPLAEDIEPDAHPTIQVCAGSDQPRRAHLVVAALAGQGDYGILVYVGPRERLAAARAVVGGRPGVATSTPPDDDDDAPSRAVGTAMVRFANAVERIGFAPAGPPVRLSGPPAGVSVERPLGAMAGRCYTVAAFRPPGKKPATITLVDAWGVPRVVSDPADDHAALQWCAEETAPHAVRVDGVAPGSPVTLAIWVAEASAVGGGRDLWLGRPPEPASALRRDARARAARALDDEGFGALRRIGTGRVPAGGASTVRLPRSRGRAGSRCRAVVVAPDGPLAEVTVTATGDGPRGAPLPDGGHVDVDCTGRPRAVRVHARRGAGGFTVFIAEAPLAGTAARGVGAAAAGPGLASRIASRLGVPPATVVEGPWPVPTAGADGADGADGAEGSSDGRFERTLPPGCLRVTATGSPGVEVTIATAVEPDDAPPVARAEGTRVTLATCLEGHAVVRAKLAPRTGAPASEGVPGAAVVAAFRR